MNTRVGLAPKRKDEQPPEIEQQFILRLPPGSAMAVKHDIDSGATNLKDKLMIELQNDMRHGRVMYGGQIFNAKLVDLPCIIESLKTTDNKAFYKTADISQMLMCNVGEEDSDEDAKKKEKRYQFPHGITPPLKNVRKRRFRKTLKKKNSEMPEIEKEVKTLLRYDNDAIEVKWEVVLENDKPEDPNAAEKQVLAHGEATRIPAIRKKGLPLEIPSLTDDFAEDDLFGEMSDDDDDDDPSTSDADIMKEATKKIFGDVSDSDNEEKVDISQLEGSSQGASGGADYSLPTAAMSEEEVHVHQKLSEIVSMLNSTREKRLQLEENRDLSNETYAPDDPINVDINGLLELENKLENEYQICASMVGQR